MEEESLEERVTLLENELRGLPERVAAVETQVTAVVVQAAEFREEVRAEFSDVRGEIAQFREQVRDECAAVRKEIKDGDDETRRPMRVLHEDLVERIVLIDRS